MSPKLRRISSTVKCIILGLDIACLSLMGWLLLEFLRYSLADPHLQHWVVIGQCLVIMLILLTGLALFAGSRWAFRITMSVLVLTYIMAAISLAIGGWAWSSVINAGSAYHALALGNRIIGEGDLSPDRVNVKLWLVEMGLMTIIMIIAARAIIGYFRRNEIREPANSE